MHTLIDTHCHLDAQRPIEGYISEAQLMGVSHMVNVSCEPADWDSHAALAQKYSKSISYSIGLHPCYASETNLEALSKMKDYFGQGTSKPVALGECGLDNYHLSKDPKEAAKQQEIQRQAFQYQLKIAKELGCPLVIHARYAIDECIQVIDASGVDWTRVIFHCFSEGPEQIKKINERGGLASFTGIITYKKAEEVRQAALQQGLDKLILETDAPYLAPTPKRGKPNEPAYTRYIAEYCAELFNVSLETICKITTKNAKRFYNINL